MAVGVFLHHGYSVVQRHRDGWELLGRLPPFCFTLAVLVWLLQPEFNFQEVGGVLSSVGVVCFTCFTSAPITLHWKVLWS